MKKISLKRLKARIKREIKELGVIDGEAIYIDNCAEDLFGELVGAWEALGRHFKKSGLAFQVFATDSQQCSWAISAKKLTEDQQKGFTTTICFG